MDNKGRDWSKFTPEKAQAWGLAMYPLIVLVLAVFLVVSKRPITADISGLLLGLTVAGSLQAAVKKKGGSDAQPNDSSDSDRDIYRHGDSPLDRPYRGRTSDSDRGSNRRIRLRVS